LATGFARMGVGGEDFGGVGPCERSGEGGVEAIFLGDWGLAPGIGGVFSLLFFLSLVVESVRLWLWLFGGGTVCG
jgi:hypothetical protein